MQNFNELYFKFNFLVNRQKKDNDGFFLKTSINSIAICQIHEIFVHLLPTVMNVNGHSIIIFWVFQINGTDKSITKFFRIRTAL